MPDVKSADDQAAAKYSKAPNYWSNITASLTKMQRQVGDLRINDIGLATGGLLVRHLVVPNHVDSAKWVVDLIAGELPERTFVDIMVQYQPYYKAKTRASTQKSIARLLEKSPRTW